ncbi:hypothetical protein M011DRAFT_487402 [Sporormia fimetaria CBS 119925]|uniref:BTB domain-containing protein n=1 Tax=Sporormia fimetaria CBS 119925 TaxID=1340428 RepID=A0A6A6V6N4_9PLEO|nr:hypothetical protein M011DRAFT_487402 [Sporormia fimetaria CBS 119925]
MTKTTDKNIPVIPENSVSVVAFRESMSNKATMSDFTILIAPVRGCEGEYTEYKVHKVYFSELSAVFRRRFASDEATATEVLRDRFYHWDVGKDFVRYFYATTWDHVFIGDWSDALAVYMLAKRYECRDIHVVADYVYKNTTDEPPCAIELSCDYWYYPTSKEEVICLVEIYYDRCTEPATTYGPVIARRSMGMWGKRRVAEIEKLNKRELVRLTKQYPAFAQDLCMEYFIQR